MSVEEVEVELEDCPECNGKGYTTGQTCCGNTTKGGECRGWCSVPEQIKCGTCAEFRAQPKSGEPAG